MRSRIPVLTFALEEKYCQHYSVTKMRIEGRMGLNLLFAVCGFSERVVTCTAENAPPLAFSGWNQALET
jgi:hypothetical protein